MSYDEAAWKNFPLFAPDGVVVPKIGEDVSGEELSPAMGALSHLLYDEDTPLEASELLRDEGNRHFKRGEKGYHDAIKKYNDAISAAADVKEALGPAYLNRAIAEYRLKNYGRALQDVKKSLDLDPQNVKAYYRATLCAVQLEKYDIALQYCDSGMDVATNSHDEQFRKHEALFKRQKANVEEVYRKSAKIESDRNKRLEAENNRIRSRDGMLESRGITMGLPLFAQQRRYSVSQPTERDGVWHWPVLLVYPEQIACPGHGDQSDFLEDVAETQTMRELLSSVFAENIPPPSWDMNRLYRSASDLEILYRTRWTMELAEADSDEESTFCGSNLPADEVGSWVGVSADSTVAELLAMKNYITPMFPVLYVVPSGIEMR